MFASNLACCNWLTINNYINFSAGQVGAGLCAPSSLDTDMNQCYVPSLAGGNCAIYTGSNCTGFGLESAFVDITSCCNRLIERYQELGFNKKDSVQMSPKGNCAFAADDNSSGKRRALRSSSSSLFSSSSALQRVPLDEATLWHPPGDYAAAQQQHLRSASPGGRALKQLKLDEDQLWAEPKADELVDQCADGVCKVRDLIYNKTLGFYNSTSVLDDLAWAGAWLYRASKDSRYLGQAEVFIERYYKEEVDPQTPNEDKVWYQHSWDNLSWAVNAMLGQMTGTGVYVTRIKRMLNAWVFATSPAEYVAGMPLATSPVNVTIQNSVKPYTYPDGRNLTVYIVPQCNATSFVEDRCSDGVDNDCDGQVDRDDIDCGFFPVQYTPKVSAPSHPLAQRSFMKGHHDAMHRRPRCRRPLSLADPCPPAWLRSVRRSWRTVLAGRCTTSWAPRGWAWCTPSTPTTWPCGACAAGRWARWPTSSAPRPTRAPLWWATRTPPASCSTAPRRAPSPSRWPTARWSSPCAPGTTPSGPTSATPSPSWWRARCWPAPT